MCKKLDTFNTILGRKWGTAFPDVSLPKLLRHCLFVNRKSPPSSVAVIVFRNSLAIVHRDSRTSPLPTLSLSLLFIFPFLLSSNIANAIIFCRKTWVQRLWVCAFFMSLMSFATTLTWVYKHRTAIDSSASYSLLDYFSMPQPAVSPNDTTTDRMACADAMNSENCTESDDVAESCQLSENVTDCDYDCQRLRCQLMRWPEKKPKAFIYFLITYERLNKMLNSLALLDKYFNTKHQYPIVVFHETEANFDIARTFLRSWTKSTMYFQTVSFQVPDFLPRNLTMRSKTCLKSFGYRHMCRFHAKLFYEQPIIRGFDYAWRLDDDSEIMSPIEYDIFEYMQNRSLQYGYTIVDNERRDCTVDLWESAERYIRNASIRPTFFSDWKRYTIYYNNFEISRLSLWLSDDYQNFINHIDRLGGIYYYRWGDAPIKTIAISMFLPRNQTHHFKHIRYIHQKLKN